VFGPLGITEVIFLFVLALLVFGPRRLPELGRTVGKALGELRKASSELKSTLDAEVGLEETSPSRHRRPPRPVPPRSLRAPEAPAEPEAAPTAGDGTKP
jgi:Tat protein translocase TatB subunit